jgi:hypothetical protein
MRKQREIGDVQSGVCTDTRRKVDAAISNSRISPPLRARVWNAANPPDAREVFGEVDSRLNPSILRPPAR